MNMTIDQKTIEKAKRTAEDLQLEGRELLELEPDYIIHACNGIGPESWPVWLRDIVSLRYKAFSVPAMIHDLRWQIERDHFSWDEVFSRHVPAFNESNSEFKRNCLRVAKSYAWWNPLRYLRRKQSQALYECLASFSYGHYMQTISEGHEKNGNNAV